ncbi:capsular polysaccharide biosynthesis protein CapF [Acidaminobacter hydrogenoformans]|uniref:UDP-2-acetamido-2,6-beta-L-arabino-hexul-4-ose reductase n=1 Tax=Acidaminobacter hydrogenoformans DSM 2784 TaxID=1120920 RepID=A0A1G5RQF4_9FIRM|nr:capsular polysaccharide biosynthesis protein CapF [Acidaminobacter hydrogenoformans]SCZ76088.1 UDP-2-acetamido-2,6-beta-L-arabino-hexul-4-ose reductase [Acidaminobacter hydrogenoformans DSM 2784]
MMILITGSKGFIGKNLIAELRNFTEFHILEYNLETEPDLLGKYCQEAEFVFHLAGINRPQDPKEYMKGNFGFTSLLLETLKKQRNLCPVMLASSIQAKLDNPYGRSKRAGENLLFEYGAETGANVLVYRFPNVFGKWCRPNYNSAVATFCHNIASDLPVQVNDPEVIMNLVYIDDVIQELILALNGKCNRNGRFCEVPVSYSIKLGDIVKQLYAFKEGRKNLCVPDMSEKFTKKLYSTYLSYLPQDQFSYPLKMNEDHRGSFTEFIRSLECGQVSVNISKPGIVKGNHWHNTKTEKFLVVSGKGVIRFRRIDSEEILEYPVSGDILEVFDIPPGYTHHIENLGGIDMVTIMWANEPYNPDKPDTFFMEV